MSICPEEFFKPYLCPNTGGKIVRESAVGDPFLAAWYRTESTFHLSRIAPTVHNPLLAIFAKDGSSAQPHYVAACLCLRDGKAYELLPSQYVRNDFGLKLITAEVEDRWKTNDFASKDAIAISSSPAAGELLGDDKLINRASVKSRQDTKTFGVPHGSSQTLLAGPDRP